jgi:hypothetical protein
VKRPGHLAGAGQKEPRPVGPARLSRAPSGSNPQDFPPQSPAPSTGKPASKKSARESPSANAQLASRTGLTMRTVARCYDGKPVRPSTLLRCAQAARIQNLGEPPGAPRFVRE